MIDQIMKDVKPKMGSSIENFRTELTKIRTGRANPALVDGVMVSYYGTPTSIKELASITAPDANQIVIKPWERTILHDIENAIRSSDLGLAPVNDGQQVRLTLPPMTEERRKEIVISIKKMGEETKVSIRNIRREAWDKVQTAEKNGEATEDDKRRAEEELNKLTAEKNGEIDKVVTEKEQEIMKI